MCVCVYIYIYIYTHTHTHIYILPSYMYTEYPPCASQSSRYFTHAISFTYFVTVDKRCSKW